MIILNSFVSFAIKNKDDLNCDKIIRSTCKDFYDAIYNIFGYHLIANLTNKVNFNDKKTSLSTTVK